jgi:4-amino-4-deoxy-L-arabinose transferase-like glycosyltransferase
MVMSETCLDHPKHPALMGRLRLRAPGIVIKTWPRAYLILLFAGAFFIRLAAVIYFAGLHEGPIGHSSSDAVQFNNIARQLALGHGYRDAAEHPPTAFRAPGFPLFLAAIYGAFGDSPAIAHVSFCLLGALACLMTYFLALEMFTETWARLAGILAAIYLPHAYFASTFLSENLFVPLLGLAVWLVIRFLTNGSIVILALAGLVFGYATLTRPFALLMLPVVLVVGSWAWWRAGRMALWPLSVFAAAFLAILTPWTYRNYATFHRFVLISTGGGATFYGGNNDLVLREPKLFGYWVPPTQLPNRDLVVAAPDEVSHDQVEWRLGKQWIRDHLAEVPLLSVLKALRLWWLPEYDDGHRWLRVASYAPFLLIFLVGAWSCLWRREYWTVNWVLIHCTLFTTIVTALIFFGLPRFRDANMPLLMLYAVVGFHRLGARAAAKTSLNHPDRQALQSLSAT